jgi:hypothetical protein
MIERDTPYPIFADHSTVTFICERIHKRRFDSFFIGKT